MARIAIIGVRTPGHIERLEFDETDAKEVLDVLERLGFRRGGGGALAPTEVAEVPAKVISAPAGSESKPEPEPDRKKRREPESEPDRKKRREPEPEPAPEDDEDKPAPSRRARSERAEPARGHDDDDDEPTPPREKSKKGGEKKTRTAQDDTDQTDDRSAKSGGGGVDIESLLGCRRVKDVVQKLVDSGMRDTKEIIGICLELRDKHQLRCMVRRGEEVERDVESLALAFIED